MLLCECERHCGFTAISAGEACDFEVAIANRLQSVIVIVWITKHGLASLII